MLIIRKEPGKEPEVKQVKNELEALPNEVGGYIECVTQMQEGVVVICDEEGMCKGKPYNMAIGGITFVGTILVAGVDGEEFCSLKPEQINRWMRALMNG